jgi:hypothetical protein
MSEEKDYPHTPLNPCPLCPRMVYLDEESIEHPFGSNQFLHLGCYRRGVYTDDGEPEAPRFSVTYTAHSQYMTECTLAPDATDEDLTATIEKIYDEVDLDRYRFDSHDEDYEPLNDAARRLVERWEREGEQRATQG